MDINDEAIDTLFTRTEVGQRARLLLAEAKANGLDTDKIDAGVRQEVRELREYTAGQDVLAKIAALALASVTLPEPAPEPEVAETGETGDEPDDWEGSDANHISDEERGTRFSIGDAVRVIDEASDAYERTGTIDRIEQSQGKQRAMVELPDPNGGETGDFASFTASQLELVNVPGNADMTTA